MGRRFVAVFGLLALVLAFDLVPFLRGGFGWQWPYHPASLPRIVAFSLLVIVYVVGAWRLERWPRAWAFAGSIAIALGVIWLRHDAPLYTLFVRTVSGVTTGPHQAAAEIEWTLATLRNWPDVMRSYDGISAHVALAPPGLPLFYAAINSALAGVPSLARPMSAVLLPYQCHNYAITAYAPPEVASAWFGVLTPVWAALAVFPLYAVARRLELPPQRATLWWPLVPAAVGFMPSWNTIYPALAVFGFWLYLVGLKRGGAYITLAGLVCGMLVFANFSVVPIAGLFGFYTLIHVWLHHRNEPARPFIIGGWYALGFFAPWVIYMALGGPSPLTLLQVAFDMHLDLDRPYLPWLWLHTWEWALLSGLPLVVLAFWRARLPAERGGAVGLALALTLALMVLSGTARGETARVWLFFAPFALIAASGAVNRRDWLPVTAVTALLLVVLMSTWDIIDTDLTPPPPSPGPVETANALDVRFSDRFSLVGWSGAVEGDQIVLRLNWRADAQSLTPYWFAGLPVADAPGETTVWQPLQTNYPTTCWQPGEIVGETVRLPIGDGDEWYVSLSAFADEATPQDRLPVIGPDGQPDTQVGLGPIR